LATVLFASGDPLALLQPNEGDETAAGEVERSCARLPVEVAKVDESATLTAPG